MLPTFVIGLREGLEASLIVGIIAAFLVKQGRRDVLRWVFVGVGAGVLLCTGVGVLLRVISQSLPQRQQEGLETVIGAIAVVTVTYMVVWMKRHSRDLKGQLEGATTSALAVGSGFALVTMAFLAVMREGFETVVFLLAAFNESGSGSAAGIGAVLGIVVAVVLGYGIYRGGVRLNLSRFFRATGLVLVFVAAGLVVNALHTAHEAGWLDVGQGATFDLTWLVTPGSVRASLLTGMLGLQGHPVVIEVIGWLVYVIPVGLYVAWPPHRSIPRAVLLRTLGGVGAAAAIAAVTFAVLTPSRPASRPVTTAGAISAQVVSGGDNSAVVRTQQQSPADRTVGALREFAVRHTAVGSRGGLAADVYTATAPGTGAAKLGPTLTTAQIAELNGGRLPIGVRPAADSVAVRYTDTSTLTVWVEPRSRRVLDVRWQETIKASIDDAVIGVVPIAQPVRTGTAALGAPAVDAAVSDARSALSRLDRHGTLRAGAWGFAVLTGLMALAAAGLLVAARRRPSGDLGAVLPDRAMASS
jgi:high-affinity iron transporter